MDSIENYTIRDNAPIKEALQILNLVHSQAMTLFVVDEAGRMIGTLTDGDIRRALISGEELSTEVQKVAHRDFRYITSENDIKGIKECRQRNLKLIPLIDENYRIVKVIDLTARKSMLPIDAVLMAGGKGERLRPLTLDIPKPLLKMGDKAIIDRNIDRLIDYGVINISVTVNYLKEKLINHFSKHKDSGIKIDCISEQKFFGTIGALKLVKKFHNDTILVMNSDLLTDIDFEDFYLHFKDNDAMMSAAAIPYTISVPYGIFDLEGRNIKGVSEKPVYNLYANAGIYLIKKDALRYIPKDEMFNATDLIEALVADKQKIIRYPLTGLWIDIGTPEEYRKAQDLVKHIK